MKKLNNIFFEPAEKTPLIDFNQLTGELILSGKSIPENAAKIYEPLLKWIIDYVDNPRTITNFRLNLEYFNTSTSIWISKLIKALCLIKEEECILYIHIYFNLEDFESIDDIQDDIIQLTNILIGETTVSIGYKIYFTDNEGNILKKSSVFI